MSKETIKVPELGEAGEVEVIELLVSVGQSVKENDSLIVLESDKAAMEIPAPRSGVVKSIAINLGDKVKTGSTIMVLEISDAEAEANDLSEPAVAGAHSQPPVHASVSTLKPESSSTARLRTELILVPDIGSDGEVEVIEVHVAIGDVLEKDAPLVTLESDKAAMDVPAPVSGKVGKLRVKVGDKVRTGTPILEIETIAESVPERKPDPSINNSRVQGSPTLLPDRTQAAQLIGTLVSAADSSVDPVGDKVYAGPAVRKLARELGVSLALVKGSGAHGRILKEDVHEFVKSRLQTESKSEGKGIPSLPEIDFTQFGEVERLERSRLQRLTSSNMHRNWLNVPHVAQFNEADVTELELFREQQKPEAEHRGVKLTFIPFLLKACCKALAEYPQFNVSLDASGGYLFQKKYYHIGVAVATDSGLVVPVIRNVNQKSLWQLAAELGELTEKARQRRLSKEEMQGACFSISSLGNLGGTGFIPIVNAPEVAILGVGKTQVKPVFVGGAFVPRNMLPLTLSYDHRAVNGVDGGLFATYLVKLLTDIRLLLL